MCTLSKHKIINYLLPFQTFVVLFILPSSVTAGLPSLLSRWVFPCFPHLHLHGSCILLILSLGLHLPLSPFTFLVSMATPSDKLISKDKKVESTSKRRHMVFTFLGPGYLSHYSSSLNLCACKCLHLIFRKAGGYGFACMYHISFTLHQLEGTEIVFISQPWDYSSGGRSGGDTCEMGFQVLWAHAEWCGWLYGRSIFSILTVFHIYCHSVCTSLQSYQSKWRFPLPHTLWPIVFSVYHFD